MHELPITKSIFKCVNAKAIEAGAEKVTRVVLEVGELREFIEVFVQKYWDYVSAGTVCEGAKIELISLPAKARCEKCGCEYKIDTEDLVNSVCPECGCETGELIAGRELRIRGMEII